MKYGLIGTFDVENYGDCLFPELYTHLIRARDPDAEIVLYSPKARPAEILSFDRIDALPSHETPDALAKLDADSLLLIGGETIGFGHSAGTYNFPRASLSAYLRLWLAPLLAARNENLRPVCFAAHAVGARKMSQAINGGIGECLSAADRVRFRDSHSATWLTGPGRAFEVDVDPMFLLSDLCPAEQWSARCVSQLPDGIVPGRYLAAQVSMGYGGNDFENWAAAVASIAQSLGLPVLLVPICHFLEDERLLARLAGLVRGRGVDAQLLPGRRNVKDTAALLGLSGGYVGSSLHGAVTALAFGQPVAVLGHSPDGKHAGTLSAVGANGVVATCSRDLPDCFANSLAMDREAIRAHARKLARASIDGLLRDLSARRSDATTEQLTDAARRLIALERAPDRSKDAKRAVLRAIRRTSGLSALYRNWRFSRAFGNV